MEKGRKIIYSDLIPTGKVEKDKVMIPNILKKVIPEHQINVADMEKLINYYYNITDIVNKRKKSRKDVNNKIAINYPYIAVTTINAYCFAQPFSYASRNVDKSKQIEALNKAMDDDKYSSKTAKSTWYSGITGLGYKFIRPATIAEAAQGKFFETVGDIDPLHTFCVYSNTLSREKIMAVNYFDRNTYDETSYEVNGTERVYNVWTKYHYWQFIDKDGQIYNVPQAFDKVEVEAYPIVKIPIIEYVRKQDRTGDFELAKSLIDAINILASNRIDSVQQVVDYLLKLRDINTDGEHLEQIKECLKEGILSYRSIEGATVQPEVDILNIPLNQSEVQTLQDFLCNKVEEVLCIPNRETRSSGGDTGLAVESRAGYRSLENIAGLITLNAIEAESEALDVILTLCSNYTNCPFADLTVNDIQIKANRNKVENVTSAANAYNVLRSAGMNDETAMTVTNIVADPYSVAKKNKDEMGENETIKGIGTAPNEQGSNSGVTENE